MPEFDDDRLSFGSMLWNPARSTVTLTGWALSETLGGFAMASTPPIRTPVLPADGARVTVLTSASVRSYPDQSPKG
jgi:hypothetical protein